MLLALSKPIWVTLLSREGGKGNLLLGGIRVLCTEYGPYRGMRAPSIGKKWIELSFACLVRETPETLLTRIFTSLPGKTTQRHRNASRALSPETRTVET